MKFKIFSVYDIAAENFNTPMFMAAKGQAIRAFDDEVNREGSQIGKHPVDYELFYIGEYDDESSNITSTRPVSCGKATDYIRSAE